MNAPGRHRLLIAPIVPTLLRLAAPGIVLVAFQSAVSIADTHFVGRLGIEALAGLALVFPMVMLLQMLSAGAMGGGVSSALARALGAGDEARARRLVVHALVIGALAGLLHAGLMLGFGSMIYRALGAGPASHAQALAYSNVLFAGAILVWLANTLASILRGAGNMLIPAGSLIAATLLHIPLAAAWINGWWGFAQLGIAGAGYAYVCAFGLSALISLAVVMRPGSPLRPGRGDFELDAKVFADILRVGGLASLSALQTVLTAVALTGFVGSFGVAALAGYGIGVRLELLQVPLVFAVGQALVAMVGAATGAREVERARRVAWTGALIAAIPCALIGLVVTIWPLAWAGLFTHEPEVLEAASGYLRIVGPFYPVLGVGVALYFASQGAGRVLRPVLAASARLAIAIAGGALVVAFSGSLSAMFVVIAVAMIAYGALTALAVLRTQW